MSCVRTMEGAGDTSSPDGRIRPTLCARQRLALFRDAIAPEKALEILESEINIDLIKQHGVAAPNIRSAKLTVLDLKSIGVSSALGLRELEFDSLDLCNPAFCSSAIAAFGAKDITRSFLIDAGDAVALAGSVAIHSLQLTTQKLLESCAGCPEQAKAVLQQTHPHGGALSGVSPVVLLDTGLRAATLCELGYFMNNIITQTQASHEQTRKLGFRFR